MRQVYLAFSEQAKDAIIGGALPVVMECLVELAVCRKEFENDNGCGQQTRQNAGSANEPFDLEQ